MRFKDFINCGPKGEGHIETLDGLDPTWKLQDFSPFEVNEVFETQMPITIKTNSPSKFVTEFTVEGNIYLFVAKIHLDFIEIAFALNSNPENIANLESKSYQGKVGSGVFRSLEKMGALYDASKGDILTFNTPKLVKDKAGKFKVNPLIKFYDSKYLHKIMDDKLFGVKSPIRKETADKVFGAFELE